MTWGTWKMKNIHSPSPINSGPWAPVLYLSMIAQHNLGYLLLSHCLDVDSNVQCCLPCQTLQFHFILQGLPHITQRPAVTPRAKKYLSSIIRSYKRCLPRNLRSLMSIIKAAKYWFQSADAWKERFHYLKHHGFMTTCLVVPFLTISLFLSSICQEFWLSLSSLTSLNCKKRRSLFHRTQLEHWTLGRSRYNHAAVTICFL